MSTKEILNSIKIKPKKYSYDTLSTLLDKYGQGHYVDKKFDYELYEFEL